MTLHDECQIVFNELFSTLFGMHRIANFSKSFTGDCAIIRSNHDNSAPPSIYPGDSKSLRVLEAGSLLAKEYFLNF